MTLVWILAGVVVLGVLLLATAKWTGVDAEDSRLLIQLLFTAMVTLVSTVIGFYFGSESREKSVESIDV